jgi:cyclophilin family peptidyl-prolyl cis-trans isomerase
MACGGLFMAACVFTPPPPLPEELAAQEAEAAARAEAVQGGQATDPQAPVDPSRFEAGQPPEVGMTFEEMKAYATAQGDPEGGDFTLEEALEGIPGKPGQGQLWARLVMTKGEIECQLFEKQAPRTVANFVGLARGKRPTLAPDGSGWREVRYYDGTEFHRVIRGFMIQGGDPSGTGRGNTGYVIPDEFDPKLRHDSAGLLSMANRGPGTGSGQFFITLGPTPHLNDKHTIFGRCTEASVDLAEAIANTGGQGDRPTSPQIVHRVEIERRNADGTVVSTPGDPERNKPRKPLTESDLVDDEGADAAAPDEDEDEDEAGADEASPDDES